MVAAALVLACCAPGKVPRTALDAMRATNNVFAAATKACDLALDARYTNQSDDAIARGDREAFNRLREAHVHRINQLHSLRDLAFFGERLLDMAAAGGAVLDEVKAWTKAMSTKLDALLVEVASAGASVPAEATRAVLALRALAGALR